MTCKETENKLFLYLSDKLPADEKIAVENHLKTCSSCRSKLRLLQEVDSLAEKEASEEPDPFIYNRIKAAIGDIKPQKTTTVRLSSWQTVAVAALVILGLFLGNWLGKTYVNTVSEENMAYVEDQDQYLFVSYDQMDSYFLLNQN